MLRNPRSAMPSRSIRSILNMTGGSPDDEEMSEKLARPAVNPLTRKLPSALTATIWPGSGNAVSDRTNTENRKPESLASVWLSAFPSITTVPATVTPLKALTSKPDTSRSTTSKDKGSERIESEGTELVVNAADPLIASSRAGKISIWYFPGATFSTRNSPSLFEGDDQGAPE